jgi:hypothetical protein
MINTTLVFSYGQMVLDSGKPKKATLKMEPQDPEEHQIIEGYEGECEKCAQTKPQKACTICGE